MNKTELLKSLYDLQDLSYRDMQIKIIPTIEKESVIGVRTPEWWELRALFLSNRLIFRPKSRIIGRKGRTLDERSSYEVF